MFSHSFKWVFIIAVHNSQLLEQISLRHFMLLVDMRHKHLTDTTLIYLSKEFFHGIPLLVHLSCQSNQIIFTLLLIAVPSPYSSVLSQQHYTPHRGYCPPSDCHLALDRLHVAKQELEHMMQLGVIHPSS